MVFVRGGGDGGAGEGGRERRSWEDMRSGVVMPLLAWWMRVSMLGKGREGGRMYL